MIIETINTLFKELKEENLQGFFNSWSNLTVEEQHVAVMYIDPSTNYNLLALAARTTGTKNLEEDAKVVINLLLTSGAIINHPNPLGQTMLHTASMVGDYAIITEYLALGANPLVKNRWGYSPFDLAELSDSQVYFDNWVTGFGYQNYLQFLEYNGYAPNKCGCFTLDNIYYAEIPSPYQEYDYILICPDGSIEGFVTEQNQIHDTINLVG